MVRAGYVFWLCSALGFIANELTLIIALAASVAPGGLGSLFLGSLAFVIGLPLSWVLWYRTLYAAAQTDGATFMCARRALPVAGARLLHLAAALCPARCRARARVPLDPSVPGSLARRRCEQTPPPPQPPRRSYVRLFVYLIAHMAWSGLLAVSPPGLGNFMFGLLPMISFFKAGGGAGGFLGVLSAVNTGLWGLSAVGMWVLLGWSVQAFRAGNTPRQLFEQKYGVAA